MSSPGGFWVFRKTQWVALLTTDLDLSVSQIIEYYGARWKIESGLKADPERRHKVKGRTSFAFSDVRRIIAEAALDPNFERVCPKPGKPSDNSLVAVLLRMVA